MRFLAIGTPGLMISLVLTAGIFLGWFPVAFSGARPISMSVSHGTADSMLVAIGTDQSITQLSPGDQPRGVALVDITDGRLDDLCLLLRADIPFLGRWGSMRVTSPDVVKLGQVTLASRELTTGGLDTGPMAIGAPAGEAETKLGAIERDSFTVISEGDDATVMTNLNADVYGLVLRNGMTLSSAAVRAAWGDQTC